MIGLCLILTSLIFSALWLSLLFGNRHAKVLGMHYETLMFASVASAVFGSILIRVGV